VRISFIVDFQINPEHVTGGGDDPLLTSLERTLGVAIQKQMIFAPVLVEDDVVKD
jgi:hypothetical protein